MSGTQFYKKGKKRNVARDVAIYLSREMTGESCVTLGHYFGGISGAGITVRYNHITKKIKVIAAYEGGSTEYERK